MHEIKEKLHELYCIVAQIYKKVARLQELHGVARGGVMVVQPIILVYQRVTAELHELHGKKHFFLFFFERDWLRNKPKKTMQRYIF